MTRERVAITGIGAVSAAGADAPQCWESVRAGRSGLRALTLFDSPRCGQMPVGQLTDDCVRRHFVKGLSRTDWLALAAAKEAFTRAGLNKLDANELESVGVSFGICTGGMLDTEALIGDCVSGRIPDTRKLRHHECASPANAVARTLKLGGFRCTLSTACTSGALAVAAACDAILSGEADIMLAGGADCLTRLTLNGFCSLLNVSPEGCRPFDINRAGMSLGEGAGVLVLERESLALARGAKIMAYVVGTGVTCDAFHLTAPPPDGAGIHDAMRNAIYAAGLRLNEIDYINAHGTGTRENDAAEGSAIARLFAGAIPAVSSTKRCFGHTLAASGAIEAVLCVQALTHQFIPGNAGLIEPDPAIPVSPLMESRPAKLRAVLSNSLGFGGNNCALLFTAADFITAEGVHP